MNKAICALSVIPMRAEPTDRSELVSQMLFGETCNIVEENDKWYKVLTHLDNYDGWIDKKQIAPFEALSDEGTTVILNKDNIKADTPLGIVTLFAGSRLTMKDSAYYCGNQTVSIDIPLKAIDILNQSEMIVAAQSMLNTPYLWGGRTRAGIDCSGFTQLMYLLMGIAIARDASKQVNEGVTVDFEQNRTTDMAFFQTANGNIVHVGLLLPHNKIIHASGRVRIDTLTKVGIFNNENQTYTHTLHSIKRLIP